MSYFDTAKNLFPGGVHSPVRSFKHIGIDPVYFEKAKGAYLYDTDGKAYVDFCLGFGPHLLGHSHPVIVEAIQKQAALSTVMGACNPGEIELAALIRRAFPFAEKMRFVNSGTEATMTAVRLARGFTQKRKVIKFDGCFHGHADLFLVKAGSGAAEHVEGDSAGVPKGVIEDTLSLPWMDFEKIEKAMATNDVAALILEPIPQNNGLKIPSRDEIANLVKICRAHNVVTIFDEIYSGCRIGIGGAAHYYDINPDLITLGKVVGGTLPMAILGGKKEIMDYLAPLGPVYQAGTFAAHPLCVAAATATLSYLFEHKAEYAALDRRTEAFVKELNKLSERNSPMKINHLNSVFWIYFGEDSTAFPPKIGTAEADRYRNFFKKCLEQGVYLAPSPYEVAFTSFAHTDAVFDEALEKIKKCLN